MGNLGAAEIYFDAVGVVARGAREKSNAYSNRALTHSLSTQVGLTADIYVLQQYLRGVSCTFSSASIRFAHSEDLNHSCAITGERN